MKHMKHIQKPSLKLCVMVLALALFTLLAAPPAQAATRLVVRDSLGLPGLNLTCLLLGCQVDNGLVRVDDFQRTTVPSIYCAGEPTGIGGVELSLIEGQIGGFAAAGNTTEAAKLFAARERGRRFARRLDRTFRLRSELRGLASPETIVCRCEDVDFSRLHSHTSWRAAKLQTRCGMGPCQGRICGPATQFLLNWTPDSVRPPIFPTRLESMAAISGELVEEHSRFTGEQ